MFQAQQATESGSFGHMVLSLELRTEEMSYVIKVTKPGMCQGCP